LLISQLKNEPENRSVGGSIPPLGTIEIHDLAATSQFEKSLCPHYVRINVVGQPRRLLPEEIPTACR
jgi:hypothetical protein